MTLGYKKTDFYGKLIILVHKKTGYNHWTPAITIKNGRSEAVRYNRVWLYFVGTNKLKFRKFVNIKT